MAERQGGGQKRAKRVRTGCKTCKVRRVKCDETRPECNRCMAFGPGYCDGYEFGSLSRNQPEKRPILPRSQLLARKPQPQVDPSIESFLDEDEYGCFRLYCEEAAPKLSFSSQSIWHRLLLQAGQSQPFIRHAIITIGALCKSSKTIGSKQVSTLGVQKLPQLFKGCTGGVSDSKKWYEFALQQYDKFLAGAKMQISTDVGLTEEHSRRTALIACLLVVCIENLQFHYSVAVKHAQHGLCLMQEYLDTTPKRNFQYGESSSAPYVIEDELVLQFKRLDLQTLSLYGARSPIEHCKVKNEGSSRMRNIPQAFTSIDEARLYLDIVMRRSSHFIAFAIKGKPSQYTMHQTVIHGSVIETVCNWPKNRPEHDGLSSLPSIADEFQVEQEMYAAENRRWSQAFEPLFKSALHNMDEPNSLKSFLLKIHSTSLMIRLGGILCTSQLIWDNFIPEFRQIVSLSKIILNHPGSDSLFAAGSFSFDMGIIYPLQSVGYCCRDRKLRRDAIALLESKSWREAQWGSLPTVHISRFLMEVEEEGVDSDFIPDWARARLAGIQINTKTGAARVSCIRGTGDEAVSRYSVWH